MVQVAAFAFGAAMLLAIASSAWVRPDIPLGRTFWILTGFVAALPLVGVLIFLLFASPDAYGYGSIGIAAVLIVFAPVAAGWLLGVLVSIFARFVRARVGR